MAKTMTTRLGPDLSKVGGRVHAGWIDAWLAAPDKVRPGTVMPALFADDADGAVSVMRSPITWRRWAVLLRSTPGRPAKRMNCKARPAAKFSSTPSAASPATAKKRRIKRRVRRKSVYLSSPPNRPTIPDRPRQQDDAEKLAGISQESAGDRSQRPYAAHAAARQRGRGSRAISCVNRRRRTSATICRGRRRSSKCWPPSSVWIIAPTN